MEERTKMQSIADDVDELYNELIKKNWGITAAFEICKAYIGRQEGPTGKPGPMGPQGMRGRSYDDE